MASYPSLSTKEYFIALIQIDSDRKSFWCNLLKTLVLSRTTSLRFFGLEMLVRSCPRLQAVDVSHCCQFGDRETATLSCAAELREIKMDKCLKLTDVGLAKIVVRCEKLEKMSLKWYLDITYLGIEG
ncbi:hypothetical protein E3N88_40067 [Mikania micrantha]|uniref:COI1 F-box domain-containing protein n=1 Tax=Mikania micrantha TaxID=192012 RepID=A0A5N6LLI1_9ASTR|nr:hypothetical protein E3N88_40067 [Mikania micrantha]